MAKTKVIAYLGPSASRLYRYEQIAKYLNRTGEYECLVSPNDVQDRELLWADIIFVHSLVDPKMIAMLWAYQIERGKTIIVDRDDVITVEGHNPFKADHDRLHAVSWSQELLKIADRVTVTTDTIANEVKPYNENVVIIPNYLDMELWDRLPAKNEGRMLRLGWMGSVTHREDLMMVMPAIKEILKRHTNVQFVICGDPYFLRELQDVPRQQWEYIDATIDFYKWPAKARTMSLDIGIAPLTDTHFNRGRSFLKYLEYAMTGASGVYSMVAYSEAVRQGETGLLAATPEEFGEAIEQLIIDTPLRNRIRKEARRDVRRHFDIKRHISEYDELFSAALQNRRRAFKRARR